MSEPTLPLRTILESVHWQKMQRHFSEVLGVTMATFDTQGNFVSDATKPRWLSDEAFRVCIYSLNLCRKTIFTDKSFQEEHWREGIKCSWGLYYYPVPMKVLGVTVGYILAGPVILISRPQPQQVRIDAEHRKSGIDESSLSETISLLKVFTFTNIQSVIELLYDIASYILELAYKDKKLAGSIFDAPDLHQSLYLRYIDKIMRALLEVTVQFTNSERASVMLYDAASQELYIKAAKGISQDVIDSTRLRLGEGIAGLVAQYRKSIIITDQRVKDRTIKKRLHLPDLKSAVSMPIAVQEKLIGVLNVATFQSEKARFFTRSIPVIDSFIKLAETTLTDFINHSLS